MRPCANSWEQTMDRPIWRPQVKICGLTVPEQAAECARLGADAIGLVFFHRSPRYLEEEQAQAVCQALPRGMTRVGVFVDEPFSAIMQKAEVCGLKAVQLHGQETPELVARLKKEGLVIIKGLYTQRPPGLEMAEQFDADGFLIECGKGSLPGGNAMTWNWAESRPFGQRYPLVLAGGLTPENVARAVAEAQPDAVDISSGVESEPGQKDIAKINAFMNAMEGCALNREPRRIF